MACVAAALVCAVLAVAPPVGALRCYQCADSLLTSSHLPGLDATSWGGDGLPCSQFDGSSERFQTECQSALTFAGIKAACAKFDVGNTTIRSCVSSVSGAGCQETASLAICYCETDLCNSAGVPAPGLLPLLVVPLLAGWIAA